MTLLLVGKIHTLTAQAGTANGWGTLLPSAPSPGGKGALLCEGCGHSDNRPFSKLAAQGVCPAVQYPPAFRTFYSKDNHTFSFSASGTSEVAAVPSK